METVLYMIHRLDLLCYFNQRDQIYADFGTLSLLVVRRFEGKNSALILERCGFLSKLKEKKERSGFELRLKYY